MMRYHSSFPRLHTFAMTAAVTLLLISACGDQSVRPSDALLNSTTVAKGTEVDSLPRRGKQRLVAPPAKAVFGMVFLSTVTDREYIFDGAEWMPHDQSIDSFTTKTSAKTVALSVEEVCIDGDLSCTPTGAHGDLLMQPAGHSAFDCKVCHKVGGRLSFNKAGPAYATGKPAPSFSATAKTCSNVACHGVAAGTFSYYFPGGDGEPELKTVSYGGTTSSGSTPSWYAAGATACTACHGNPPASGSLGGSNVWHSGYHGGQGPSGTSNQCQFCHPDVSSTGNGIGDTITNPSMHANGTVDVQAAFKSSCFGCH